MLCNYHFHDKRSFDAVGSLEENIVEALQNGVTHVGISNHPDNVFGNGMLDWGSIDIPEAIERFSTGRKECELLREKYPELKIAYGYESNFDDHYTVLQTEIEKAVKFDFIIGSLHTVDGHDIAGHGDALFKKHSYKDVVQRYFELMVHFLPSSSCTHIGHIDLFKRYGAGFYNTRWDITPHKDILKKLVEILLDKNVGVEINCSGLFSSAKEAFPSPELLSFFVENGMKKFTLGSDSHKPKDFARGLVEGKKLLDHFNITPFIYSV